MDRQTIDAVQSTWNAVKAIESQAAALFYRNLFELDPALRSLFRGDMEAQGRKLMQVIGAAVGMLDDLGALVPVLQDLGRRHVVYGVEDAHYDAVGAALLKTLEQELGAGFTPRVRDAWAEVYALLANVMISASRAEGGRAPRAGPAEIRPAGPAPRDAV